MGEIAHHHSSVLSHVIFLFSHSARGWCTFRSVAQYTCIRYATCGEVTCASLSLSFCSHVIVVVQLCHGHLAV